MEQPQTLQSKTSHDFLKSVPPTILNANNTPTVEKKVIPLPQQTIARQPSILRGTASSRAKAVRPPSNSVEQRKFSMKNRKQSLTNMVDPNRFIVNQQRRSSWSPLAQQQQQERKASISPIPPVPVDTEKYQQELQLQKERQKQQLQSALPLPNNNTTLAKKAAAVVATIATPDTQNRSIVNATTTTRSTAASSSLSNSSSSSSSSNLSVNTTVAQVISKHHNKLKNSSSSSSSATNTAAAATNAQQQQQQQQDIIPLEIPPPDDDDEEKAKVFSTTQGELIYDDLSNKQDNDDEVSNIRSSVVPVPHPLHHHHHFQENEDESHLPGYMRRPICAACNRNVKITSSSESLLQQSSSSSSSSRRSSSMSASSTNHHHVAAVNKRRNSSTITKEENNHMKITTSSTTTHRSHISNNEDTRSHSPTSPIPTRKHVNGNASSMRRRKSALLKEISSKQPQEEEEMDEQQKQQQQQQQDDEVVVDKSTAKQQQVNSNKWNQLLSQQQKLLEYINRDNPSTMMTLNRNNQGEEVDDETMILETQLEILKRFESFLLSNHLNASSSSSHLISTVTAETSSLHTDKGIENNNDPKLDIASWQTRYEYSMTRMRWNMSEWFFGSIVGSGEILEQDFDALGYTKNVVISGVCVTTESGLLPKNLQKYYSTKDKSEMVCHRYIIQTKDRETRLSKFALLDSKDWVQDDQVDQCEFSIREQVDEHLQRTRHCSIEFGVLHRRHHCRCCGHIFCQAHSSNRLPLFLPNGQERGEWSRVCDTCFFARIEPQFISRS